MSTERGIRLSLSGAARAVMEGVPSTTEISKDADTAASLLADTALSAVHEGGYSPRRTCGDRQPMNLAQPPSYASGSD
jgi:hypothetical protein